MERWLRGKRVFKYVGFTFLFNVFKISYSCLTVFHIFHKSPVFRSCLKHQFLRGILSFTKQNVMASVMIFQLLRVPFSNALVYFNAVPSCGDVPVCSLCYLDVSIIFGVAKHICCVSSICQSYLCIFCKQPFFVQQSSSPI